MSQDSPCPVLHPGHDHAPLSECIFLCEQAGKSKGPRGAICPSMLLAGAASSAGWLKAFPPGRTNTHLQPDASQPDARQHLLHSARRLELPVSLGLRRACPYTNSGLQNWRSSSPRRQLCGAVSMCSGDTLDLHIDSVGEGEGCSLWFYMHWLSQITLFSARLPLK